MCTRLGRRLPGKAQEVHSRIDDIGHHRQPEGTAPTSKGQPLNHDKTWKGREIYQVGRLQHRFIAVLRRACTRLGRRLPGKRHRRCTSRVDDIGHHRQPEGTAPTSKGQPLNHDKTWKGREIYQVGRLQCRSARSHHHIASAVLPRRRHLLPQT